MNLTACQQYRDLTDFVNATACWLTVPKTWRLIKQPLIGEINGLPQFRGKTIATNGILVAIQTPTGLIHVGHLEWFQVDQVETSSLRKETKTSKQTNNLISFFESEMNED